MRSIVISGIMLIAGASTALAQGKVDVNTAPTVNENAAADTSITQVAVDKADDASELGRSVSGNGTIEANTQEGEKSGRVPIGPRPTDPGSGGTIVTDPVSEKFCETWPGGCKGDAEDTGEKEGEASEPTETEGSEEDGEKKKSLR